MNFRFFFTVLSLFIICLFNSTSVDAQMDPHSEKFMMAIDSLFDEKSDMSVPGAAVIVIKDKQVILSKSVGSANLSHGVPFDENTEFPLEEFSEQLVAFSILQLEQKGRIKLHDPVNKYVPELGFSDNITVSHFINHSSDFPMLSSLRIMAGHKYDDPFSHDDFLSLTKSVSSGLNPGKTFNHNHGGIKILMMVIESISKKSFADYVKANIFMPLGMTQTSIKTHGFLETSNSTVGYTVSDEGYQKVIPGQFEIFCPHTYTTQSDFQKWMLNIQTKKVFGNIIEQLDRPLTINGQLQERSYGSFCIGQHQYRHYLGQDEFFKRETGEGYSWMWLRLSQSQLSVMAVGNLDTYIGPQVNGIADLIGEYLCPVVSEDTQEASDKITFTEKELESYVGTYWNDDYLYTTEISIQDGGLFHADTDNGFNFMMTPITKTLFETPFGGTVEFSNLGGTDNRMKNIIPNGREFDYKEYHVPVLKEGDQVKYVGIYASDKLGAFYQVVWENNTLILKRARKPDLVLSPMGNHQFRTPDIDLRLITFEELEKGAFQVMTMSSPAVRSFPFKRM